MTVMMIQRNSSIGSPGSVNQQNVGGVMSADAINETVLTNV